MSVRDYVIAAAGSGSDLVVEIRDLRTNAFVADHTFTGTGVGRGNGYIAALPFAMNPHDPVYFATGESIAKCDLTAGALLGVIPTTPPYASIDAGGVAYVTDFPHYDVVQFSTPASSDHTSAQKISPAGVPILVSPTAPGDITAGAPLGLAGAGNNESGILVAIDTYLYDWTFASNTFDVGPTIPCASGSIRRIQYGQQVVSISTGAGFGMAGDIIWGSATAITPDTSPAVITAGGLASDNSAGRASPGRFCYATGSDGTTIWLYVMDAVGLTIGVVCALPDTYGIPDSVCMSYDGTVAYCLCSAAGVGYPVTIATGAIGTVSTWGVASPQRATLWPVTETGAPWVLGHVEVAPAASPWLVGLVP